jgi:2-polyprenyl-6-methoxyphenol hydroxylase-like FAD-dependent oxidoreductase
MALGYLLARRGVEVTVLESHTDFVREFRGEGLQRSGIDAFRQMGLAERFEQLPHTELRAIEFYSSGRMILRADPSKFGRDGARLVSQPALLEMLADEAGRYAGFRLDRGVAVRDLLCENDRVVGVRCSGPDGPREYRADLVIGADGRNAVTRKRSGLAEPSTPQTYDIVWLKVPLPDDYPDRTTATNAMSESGSAIAFPTADGQLQVGFIIPKGSYATLRARGDKGIDEMVGRFQPSLAKHLSRHRQAFSAIAVLDVVCGRLTEWSRPGLLLMGDAAHPMSPVGGQGVNIALRDAIVAANHLCPVLTAGGGAEAIDEAARKFQEERWPEIVAVQEMQQAQSRMLSGGSRLKTRIIRFVLPLMIRSGFLSFLRRKFNKQMSEGVVPVRLVV